MDVSRRRGRELHRPRSRRRGRGLDRPRTGSSDAAGGIRPRRAAATPPPTTPRPTRYPEDTGFDWSETSDGSFSHYDEMGLGKAKDSTFEEIKRAYLINSLKYHPHKDMTAFDKYYAKANFVRQYQAFEVLGNEHARKRYDAALNGGHHLDLYAEASAYKRASAHFHGYFGKHLWRRWEQGTQVSGTVHRNCEKFLVTIYPDGTSSEEPTGERTGHCHAEHGFHLLLHSFPTGGVLAATWVTRRRRNLGETKPVRAHFCRGRRPRPDAGETRRRDLECLAGAGMDPPAPHHGSRCGRLRLRIRGRRADAVGDCGRRDCHLPDVLPTEGAQEAEEGQEARGLVSWG